MDRSGIILRISVLMLLLFGSTDAKMEIISNTADVLLGAEHMLLCKAGGEGDITWRKDGDPIDDDEMVKKVDEVSSQLTIHKAKFEDSGRYTCVCDFEAGYKNDITYQLYVYERPSFTGTTVYHEFLVGQDSVIPCVVSGNPTPEVHWLRDHQVVDTSGKRLRQLPDNSLQIQKVSRDDAGSYVCEAKIKNRPITETLTISVAVNVPPSVRLREEVKKVMAGPETNVSLLCLVEGHPTPNISWITPVNSDPSRHHFNSDRSQMTIRSVARGDYGEYVCTARNKIAESSATLMLHVSELPKVYLSSEEQDAELGQSMSVSCNISGHPTPEQRWHSKTTGHTLKANSGRVRVEEGVLVIDKVESSDGGLYSCMAISQSGNISRDFRLHTPPGPLLHVTASPGPSSIHFTLGAPIIDGGAPITEYALQWRPALTEQWQETIVQATEPLVIMPLQPFTNYMARLASRNRLGQGNFSHTCSTRTQGIREPDSPVLSRDLTFGSDYQLEVLAVNSNGSSSPAKMEFSVPLQPVKVAKPGMGKGAVVGLIMVIFLLLLLAVDAACCYTNHCGLLMFLSVKLFGQRVPGLKTVEEGDATVNGGEVKLNGLDTPRGSISKQQTGGNDQRAGGLTEVTCDKAPLTKFEKTPTNADPPASDA
ncbi:neural cell adhesion molecule 1 [Aplochiton taeniatus]